MVVSWLRLFSSWVMTRREYMISGTATARVSTMMLKKARTVSLAPSK